MVRGVFWPKAKGQHNQSWRQKTFWYTISHTWSELPPVLSQKSSRWNLRGSRNLCTNPDSTCMELPDSPYISSLGLWCSSPLRSLTSLCLQGKLSLCNRESSDMTSPGRPPSPCGVVSVVTVSHTVLRVCLLIISLSLVQRWFVFLPMNYKL